MGHCVHHTKEQAEVRYLEKLLVELAEQSALWKDYQSETKYQLRC
jgi:hypothetical protein